MENLTICCSFIPADRLYFQFLTSELGFSKQASRSCFEVDGKQIELLYLSINKLKHPERDVLTKSSPCQGSVMMSGNVSGSLRAILQLTDFKPILYIDYLETS